MGRSRELAELGSAYDSGNSLGFRNRIINGDMRIDQRNAGASVSTPPNYTLDRWKVRYSSNGGTAGTCTVQRSTTAPTGFTNSFLLTVGTARTVISGDRFGVEQPIEGFNMADLGWGTSSAQSVTLSFWVRSSVTGTFGLCFSNFSRGYAATYTVNSANTWEYKTVSIAGDTAGTWANDSSTGVVVAFDLGMGSDVRATPGSWQAGTFLGASGAVNVVSTSGATFYITGVQLEAGSVATPFERRPYGTELALCQRYYEKSYDLGTVPGTATATGAITASGPQGTANTNEVNAGNTRYKVSKRATPTVTIYDTNGNSGKCTRVSAAFGSNVNQPITLDTPSANSEGFYAYSSSGTSATGAIIQYTASAEL